MEKREFTVEEVWIRDGEKRIYGKLYAPEGTGVHPAVLLSHGYMGTHADFAEEAACFARHGFLALAYDFCGGSPASKSSGKSTQMSVLTEKEELLAALDYVKATGRADNERLFLMGASQGGFVSALAAAQRPEEICALILYYPALCIPDDWKRMYPRTEDMPENVNFWGMDLGRRYREDAGSLDPYREIVKFEKNVLILHGDRDEVVALSYSERAKESYRRAQLEVLEGEGHGFSPQKREWAQKQALRFLQENLPH